MSKSAILDKMKSGELARLNVYSSRLKARNGQTSIDKSIGRSFVWFPNSREPMLADAGS